MTDHEQRSPRIAGCRWGRVSIDGHGTSGGARAWDWHETGTRHDPGIRPADVFELLEHGAEVVVLSEGVLRMLKVYPETLALLREKGIRVHFLPTGEAVTTYNLLRETERVGALIHSTC